MSEQKTIEAAPVAPPVEDSAEQQILAAQEVLAALNDADAPPVQPLEEVGEGPAEETVRTPTQIIGKRKSPAKKSAPKAASVPAKVKKMLGDGERYRFYKTDKLGKNSLISDYTASDMENANGDIELFIQAYLVDTFGPGEYLVKAFSDKGVELRQGSYSVMSPKGVRPSALPSAGGAGVFEQTQLTSQTKMLNELQEQIRQSEKEENDSLRAANDKQSATIASMQDGGGNQMMQMMMMMQQQQDAAQRRSEAAQRRSELSMEKLRLEAQLATPAVIPLPPPPPPPPPADPLATIIPLLGLLKEMMPKAPEQSVETMYLRDRVKDLENSSNGPRTMTDAFQEANQMDELFNSRYGSGQSSSATDMVKSFMDNFAENMNSLKGVITAGAGETGGPKQLSDGGKKPDPDALPDGFIELVMKLDEAGEEPHPDLARINVILEVLQLFGNCGTPKYEMIAKQTIAQISENKKRPVMWMLKQILEECTNREMIQEQSSIDTYKAFDRHFDQVFESVTGKKLDKPVAEAEQPPPPAEPLPPADAEKTSVHGTIETVEEDGKATEADLASDEAIVLDKSSETA